ncbi:MAG TPA: TonB family protein [Sphingomicrobium sp.]|nr:TonB family protein [Sphingomicrobium sp.]
MLGYAAETRPARRKASPTTLALIVAGHAALILAVISSKMNAPVRPYDPPIIVDPIPIPQDPTPNPPVPAGPSANPRAPTPTSLDPPIEIVPIPLPGPIELGPMPPIPGGNGIGEITDPPVPLLRVGPRLAISENLIRPPYPEAKRRLEQEAVLRLRLGIDDHGRVRSVDPVGAADPMFLASARSHLIRNWRYAPATEGGRPVASSIVITLRFELDEV